MNVGGTGRGGRFRDVPSDHAVSHAVGVVDERVHAMRPVAEKHTTSNEKDGLGEEQSRGGKETEEKDASENEGEAEKSRVEHDTGFDRLRASHVTPST